MFALFAFIELGFKRIPLACGILPYLRAFNDLLACIPAFALVVGTLSCPRRFQKEDKKDGQGQDYEDYVGHKEQLSLASTSRILDAVLKKPL